MLRQVRAGAGLLVTIAVVVGPPAAAVWWWQHTGRRLPSRATFDAWVADPLTEVTLAVLLAFGVFAVWLLLVIAMLATISQQLRRAWARVRRMPIPTPAQATATSMAGAAAFSMPMLGATGIAVDVVPGSPDQPTPSAPHHPSPDSGGRTSVPAATEGVELADGSWLPPETAQAITVAAALGWLRRRRDYTPTPTAGQHTDDQPDLPPIVAAVQQQVADDPETSGQPTRVLGQRDRPPLLADRLPAGGVGLLGPGAMDAARGVLATALLSANTVQVVTTITDLERLLGAAIGSLAALPGLHLAADLDSAVAYLDRCNAVAGERRPVLLAKIPRADNDARRLRTALRQRGHAAVLLGDEAHGVTRRINADGTVADPAGERWCVLTQRAAADLCVLATHAHGLPSTPSHPSPDEPASSETPLSHTRQDTSRSAPGLTLTVLGPPALAYQGSPIRLRRAAALQALVLLAVDRDGVSARRLGAALWPGERPQATSGRVYTTVSELRQALTGRVGAPVVHREGERYRLDPHHIDVDLWHLHQALIPHNGTPDDSHHEDDPITTARTLGSLYTGELAAGTDWPWLEPHRERLRRRMLNTFTALAKSAGPMDRLTILQHAQNVDDCNELILRQLIAAYTILGEHSRTPELTAAIRNRLADQGLSVSDEFELFVEDLRTRYGLLGHPTHHE